MRKRERERLEKKMGTVEMAENLVRDALQLVKPLKSPVAGYVGTDQVGFADILENLANGMYQWRAKMSTELREEV